MTKLIRKSEDAKNKRDLFARIAAAEKRDGAGLWRIPEIDMLLAIKKLKGIQWIPGAGQPDASEWLDVLAKIRKAWKPCRIMTNPEGARKVVRALGGTGFVFNIFVGHSADEAERLYKELLVLNRHS